MPGNRLRRNVALFESLSESGMNKDGLFWSYVGSSNWEMALVELLDRIRELEEEVFSDE